MQSASAAAVLLSAASSTGPAVRWPGGRGTFNVVGTFGGATVSLEVIGADGATWLPVGTETTKTASGIANFDLPPTMIRASVTGGGPSGLHARADRVPA